MAYEVRKYHEDSDACSAQDFDHGWNLITRRIDDANNANKSESFSGVMENFVFKLAEGWHCSDLFFANRLSSQQDHTSALLISSILARVALSKTFDSPSIVVYFVHRVIRTSGAPLIVRRLL